MLNCNHDKDVETLLAKGIGVFFHFLLLIELNRVKNSNGYTVKSEKTYIQCTANLCIFAIYGTEFRNLPDYG